MSRISKRMMYQFAFMVQMGYQGHVLPPCLRLGVLIANNCAYCCLLIKAVNG